MLLDELRKNKTAIESLASKHGAARIRVFGSVARGEEKPESDIDLLVELPRGYDLFSQRLALKRSLESLIGHRIDLVPDHELNRHIQQQVLREAIDI